VAVEAAISTPLFAPSAVKLEVAATFVPSMIPTSVEVPNAMEAPDCVEIPRSVKVAELVEASRLEEAPDSVEASPADTPDPTPNPTEIPDPPAAEDSATSPNNANRVSITSFFFNMPILQFSYYFINVKAGHNGNCRRQPSNSAALRELAICMPETIIVLNHLIRMV
jgi:hypothetical protein